MTHSTLSVLPAAFITLVLTGCSEQPPPKPAAPTASAPAAKPAPAPAATAALGSRENPVKCDMPAGERAYLSRLRCPDGSTPTFERSGSVGAGPSGNVLDAYIVKCGGTEKTIHMDMYHTGHVEKLAVPGFTIVD